MNFSEFKKMLGAEPRNQDPEFLKAMDSDPEFRAAAEQAFSFENKLEAALRLEAPADLMQRISNVPTEAVVTPIRTPRARPWLAAAAALVAVVGMASVSFLETTEQWENVDDYIVDHWSDDGAQFLSQADGRPDPNAAVLFTRFGVNISQALAERIDYIYPCHTPQSRGAHMVITTDYGPVTLIFMPQVETVDGHILTLDQQVAATLPLESGSAVIIGPNEDVIAPIYTMARAGIRSVTGSS